MCKPAGFHGASFVFSPAVKSHSVSGTHRLRDAPVSSKRKVTFAGAAREATENEDEGGRKEAKVCATSSRNGDNSISRWSSIA